MATHRSDPLMPEAVSLPETPSRQKSQINGRAETTGFFGRWSPPPTQRTASRLNSNDTPSISYVDGVGGQSRQKKPLLEESLVLHFNMGLTMRLYQITPPLLFFSFPKQPGAIISGLQMYLRSGERLHKAPNFHMLSSLRLRSSRRMTLEMSLTAKDFPSSRVRESSEALGISRKVSIATNHSTPVAQVERAPAFSQVRVLPVARQFLARFRGAVFSPRCHFIAYG